MEEKNKNTHTHIYIMGFPGGASGKEPMCQGRRQETWVQSLGQEDPLEEGMATHSSILAWRIPWTEEPSRLQSIGSQRVGWLKQLNMNACIYVIYSLVAQMIKNPPAMLETWVRSLDWEDPLEEGIATHSSMLAWRIPWTEEPGRLQSGSCGPVVTGRQHCNQHPL